MDVRKPLDELAETNKMKKLLFLKRQYFLAFLLNVKEVGQFLFSYEKLPINVYLNSY
jgi:hypothetical protein